MPPHAGDPLAVRDRLPRWPLMDPFVILGQRRERVVNMEWLTALAGVMLGAALNWLTTVTQTAGARRRGAGCLSRRLVIALDELVLGSARVVNDARDRGDDMYDYEYHWGYFGASRFPLMTTGHRWPLPKLMQRCAWLCGWNWHFQRYVSHGTTTAMRQIAIADLTGDTGSVFRRRHEWMIAPEALSRGICRVREPASSSTVRLTGDSRQRERALPQVVSAILPTLGA